MMRLMVQFISFCLVAAFSTSCTGPNGPAVCDGAGCWLGINYGGNRIFMPRNFLRWVLRHEVYHSVLAHMLRKGIDCVVPGSETTPGHWRLVKHANGRILNARDEVLLTRWPARLKETAQAMVPGGMTPQNAWKKAPDSWNDVQCLVPDMNPRPADL